MEDKLKITVKERLDLMREKQKQIDILSYEKELIEGDIVHQMRTVWSLNPEYNMICGVFPDFLDEISGEYEKRKNDEKYLKDINWVLEIVKRKLKLPVEISSNFSFRYIEAMMFYGAGFGYNPCQTDLIFELHYFGYKPIKIKIEMPIYENVTIKDYEYELDGIQIFYEKKANIWMLACCDLEYEKLADKFQEWMNTELQNILEKEESCTKQCNLTEYIKDRSNIEQSEEPLDEEFAEHIKDAILDTLPGGLRKIIEGEDK